MPTTDVDTTEKATPASSVEYSAGVVRLGNIKPAAPEVEDATPDITGKGEAVYWGTGAVGVDIFFIISGYLIGSILIKGMQQGSFSFADFYARRVRRIHFILGHERPVRHQRVCLRRQR